MDDDSSNGKTNNGKAPSWGEVLRRIFFGRRRVLSETELQEIIEESEEEGIINEGEGEMLHSIFEFGETIVREVMVPRTDMVCAAMAPPWANFSTPSFPRAIPGFRFSKGPTTGSWAWSTPRTC